MSSRGDRGQRVVRGSVAALIATFVATVSHSSATAHPPSLLGILLGLGIAAPVCVLMAGRAQSWWRSSVAVGASQALFHSLLALRLGDGVTAATASATATATAGMTHAHHAALPSDALLSAAAVHPAESPWMWVAHAVAAVITVIVLGTGERAVRLLAALVSRVFRALAPGRVMHAAPTLPPAAPEPAVLSGLAVLSVMRRRGPPVTA
jgi:hypothetical protein